MSEVKNNYEEFNKFQNYFYTDATRFAQFSDFEIKRNSVMLLTNIAKGFPHLANDILNIYSPAVKAVECPAILIALQRSKFVNSFVRPRIPKYIYFKKNKPKKLKKEAVVSKVKKGMVEFSDDIVADICSRMRYDNKDYQDFKYSEDVQKLGKMLVEAEKTKIKG